MSSLLPPNASAQEHALAEAIARISDVPPLVRDVWNADTCPAAILPWLAWARSVDEWDSAWSEQQKRDAVKKSLAVHKKKGTIGAVRDALAAIGVNAVVTEWFNQSPAGDPYTFNVYLESNQTPLTLVDITKALAVVFTAKNLRSHLDTITIAAMSAAPVYVATVASVGNDITIPVSSEMIAQIS